MSRKKYTREEYLAAKRLGKPEMYNTQDGKVLLNVFKHYCRNDYYKNTEYQAIMLGKIKFMSEQFRKKEAEND